MRTRRREARLTEKSDRRTGNENNKRGQKAAGAASPRCNQQHGALPAQPGTTTTQRGAASSPAAQRVRVDAEQPLDAQAARAVRERSGTRKKRSLARRKAPPGDTTNLPQERRERRADRADLNVCAHCVSVKTVTKQTSTSSEGERARQNEALQQASGNVPRFARSPTSAERRWTHKPRPP